MTEVNGNIEIIQPIGKINNIEVEGNATIISANGVVETANVIGHLGIGLIERGTKDHSQLDNLDYEHSGHTGFQPAGDYATNDRVDEVEEKLDNISSQKEIQVSSSEPVDENVVLWYQTGIDIDLFAVEIVNGELIISSPDDADVDFNIINNDLIVNNNEEGLDFNIVDDNLEVEYVD